MIFPRKSIMYGVMLEGWTLRFYSAYREATTGFCIALFICCYFPRTLLTRVCSLYRRRFPPKRRLLTVEEFNEPGAREVCGPAIGHEWTCTGSSSSSSWWYNEHSDDGATND
ncbi:nuclear envelope integral membrane protein-like [Culex pipiens pallens]|uniref:nuclear envelope integral membrane protein-like n=1 Tax=Culex pipiens pallens TaxID=42434 RepID=UPI0019541E27|nr:nuclear envelope integral membrane protein-like [Culex pipiens pallens]